MDLFENEPNQTVNLLPKEGTVNYYGKIFSYPESNVYLNSLLNTIAWKNDEALVFGKHFVTKRKVAWYGDAPFNYTYSKVTKQGLSWTPELLLLKARVEERTGETFNSCLLNLYHSGEEGMGWHSDGEKDLKENGAIASLSFGAERKFAFKHKQTKEVVSLILEYGSLLVMKGLTQTHWMHRLPPSTLIKQPRVNLTFRTIDL